MKKLLLLTLLTCSSISAYETSIESLQKKVIIAAQSSNSDAIMKLYEWTNVHFIMKDQEVIDWGSTFKDELVGYKLVSVKWKSLSEMDASRRESLLSVEKVNGREYSWSHPPVGEFILIWVEENNRDTTFYGNLLIGKNKRGQEWNSNFLCHQLIQSSPFSL